MVKREFARDREDTRVIDLVCSFKSFATLEGARVSHLCREKTGGQGLISANRLSDLNAVAASLIVVEGDSMLLAQKAVRGMLMGGKGSAVGAMVSGVVSGVWGRAVTGLAGEGALGSLAALGTLLKLRCTLLVTRLKRTLMGLRGGAMIKQWQRVAQADVLHLHRADVEWRAFVALCAVADASSSGTERLLRTGQYHSSVIRDLSAFRDSHLLGKCERAALALMARVYALDAIERDLGWFMSYAGLTADAAIRVTANIDSLLQGINEVHSHQNYHSNIILILINYFLLCVFSRLCCVLSMGLGCQRNYWRCPLRWERSGLMS